MEAIATIKAIQSGWVHPTINHVSPSALPSCRRDLAGLRMHAPFATNFSFSQASGMGVEVDHQQNTLKPVLLRFPTLPPAGDPH